MPLLSALLSMLSRKIGDLLQAVFGWAVTGLFGKLPKSKQVALSAALLMSISWPVLLVGIAFPGFAAWTLAFVPLHDFAPRWVLRIVWLGLSLLVPPIVGVIARWVAPAEKRKGGALRTLLAGFPLTIGFASAFLITLVVVPALKIIAMAKGWNDEHVYCLVKKGCYESVLSQVRHAAAYGGTLTEEADVPKPMGLATKVMKFFARGGLDPIFADKPRMLRGNDVSLFLYPGDILIRGKKKPMARVRAALMRELLHADAYLTEEPAAQELEEQIHRMWEVVERHRGGPRIGVTGEMRIREIARALEKADLPVEQWTILYLNLNRLERAITRSDHLIDQELPKEWAEPEFPLAVVAERSASLVERRPHPAAQTLRSGRSPSAERRRERESEESIGALLRDATRQGTELVKLELALAKDDLRRDLAATRSAATFFGVAGFAAVLGVVMLLVGLSLAIFRGPITALAIAGTLVVVAVVCGALAAKFAPTKPLLRTRKRLRTDVQLIEETLA